MKEELIDEISGYILLKLHQQAVEDYKSNFKRLNNGNEPTQQLIDSFITQILAQNTAENQAKDIAKKWIKKIEQISKKKNLLSYVFEAGYGVTIIFNNIVLFYILYTIRIPSFLQPISIEKIGLFISIVLCTFYTLIALGKGAYSKFSTHSNS